MKKISFLLLVLLMCSIMSSFAQVEKSKWFVAATGNVNFDIGKSKIKHGGTTNEDRKYFSFKFNPMVGYFVINKLPVGLYFDVNSNTSKDPDNNYKYNVTQFIVGPFARYYITDFKKLFPYVEARAGLGSSKSKYDDNDADKESYFSTRIGAGGTYFFAKNVGLDMFVGYNYDAWTDKSSNSTAARAPAVESSGETKYTSGSVEINIGVVVTFGKE